MNFRQIETFFERRFYGLNITGKPKIFCISFQRTGTTSVGKFFTDHNFRVATSQTTRSNSWTLNWFKGDYERIFNSLDFRSKQVYEDDPWWCLDFYKVLFHRFPNSKFILLERDADKWFDSMVTHSGGKTLGNTLIHSHLYRREKEFYNSFGTKGSYENKFDNLLLISEDRRSHYTDIYKIRNQEIKEFFERFDNERLFYGDLEDSEKWVKMGLYCGFSVDPNYSVHIKSPLAKQKNVKG